MVLLKIIVDSNDSSLQRAAMQRKIAIYQAVKLFFFQHLV